MTVAQMIEQLQKMPPDSIAVWYDSECSQFQEVTAIQPVQIGIRYCGDEPDTWPVWENHFPNDSRHIKTFTAVEVNTYLEEH